MNLQDFANPPPRMRFAAWALLLAWAAAIRWLSSQTGSEIEEMNFLNLSDKAAHFIAFFAAAPLLVSALRWTFRWPLPAVGMAATLVLSAFGAVDEYFQTFVPGRSGADFGDWFADTLGALAGSMFTAFAHARIEGTTRPAPARN
jgi:VanZ family protein